MRRGWRSALLAVAVLVGGCQAAPDAATPPAPSVSPVVPVLAPLTPPQPDLGGYYELPAEDFLGTEPYPPRWTYFRTAGGLTCALLPGWAGCTGELHGTPAPANEITMGGYRLTSRPSIRPPAGFTPKVLRAGRKIVVGDSQCAVGDHAVVRCTVGSPPTRWFVVSARDAGIGPATAGFPDGFPDPKDFVETDERYIVGQPAKKGFPVFTVASGLTCRIMIFSGYEIGCDGPLPTAPHGENQIWIGGWGDERVGLVKADRPRFGAGQPGQIRRLPAQHRITDSYETGGTCLATVDGGVACFVGTRPVRGFIASPTAAYTFG